MNRGDDQVSLNIFDLIDSICREFRTEWKLGNRPQLEKFLARVPKNAQANLFYNLLDAEIRYRKRLGDTPTSAEYLKKYADFSNQIRQAFDESTFGSLEEVASQSSLGGNADAVTQTHEMPAANRLGDYELIRELGRGGFGVVYEAKHIKRGNRVALKTLPTGVDGQELNADRLHRFRKEFRSLSEVNHPNLVGMQTLEVDGAQWFFTMDLIEGEDFLSYVRPMGQLNEDRLRSAIKQLAGGIVFLHQCKIVHRDLKPSNVLVDQQGRVVILDFGLVAQLQTQTDLTVSRSGMFAGTPRYAAPEQMFGQRSEASDWYAFGTMLYEALTGQPPFTGKQMELLRKKHSEDPPRLAGQMEIRIANDLSKLVDGLLKRNPSQRLESRDIAHILCLNLDTRSFGSTAGSTGSTGSDGEDQIEFELPSEEEIVLIGREDQLAQLNAAQEELLAATKPIVAWVKGLSGEGKSSLVEEFLRPIRRNPEMGVLAGRCYDQESVPFKVIDSQIDSLVHFLRSRSKSEVESWLPPDIEMLAKIFPILRRVKGIHERSKTTRANVPEQQVRNLAFAALKDLLFAISETFPLVLFVDDLQWGDADSAEMMVRLLSPPRPPRLMFVGSFRSDEIAESGFLREWNEQSKISADLECREILVEPLSKTECMAFLKSRLGRDFENSDSQKEEIYCESQGNPYFLEQLIETFDQDAKDFESIPMAQIIERRLSRAPLGAKQLLEWMAVYGKAISMSEISEFVEAEIDVVSTLTHMRSERLVRLIGNKLEAKVDTYHDKIRESVIANLPPKKRRIQHLRIAESLELNRRERIEGDDNQSHQTDELFELARHFLEAEDERAFKYQLCAGQFALQGYAIEIALAHFQTAEKIRGTRLSKSDEFALQFGLAKTLCAVGHLDEAHKKFEFALDIASNDIDRSTCLYSMAEINWQKNDYERTWTQIRSAFKEIGESFPKTKFGRLVKFALAATVFHLIPSWIIRTKDNHRARIRWAASMYRGLVGTIGQQDIPAFMLGCTATAARAKFSEDPEEKSASFGAYGYLLSFVGLGFIARRVISTAKREAEKSGYLVHFHGFTGTHYYATGQLEAAEEYLDLCCNFYRRSGEYMRWQYEHIFWHLWAIRGSSARILKHAKFENEVASVANAKIILAFSKYGLAEGLARQGNTRDAIPLVDSAVSDLKAANVEFGYCIALIQQSKVYLQSGDYETARQSLAETIRELPKLRYVELTAPAFALWVETALGPNWSSRTRNVESGIKLSLAIHVARFSGWLFPSHLAAAFRMRGRYAASRGKTKRANRYFDRSISAAKKVGAQYELARAMIDKSMIEQDSSINREQGLRLLESLGCVLPESEVDNLEIDPREHHARAAAAAKKCESSWSDS